MKILKSLALGTLALLGLGFLAIPSAQAGTRVNINIGGGGYYRPAYYRPVAYYPQPCYAQPTYRPVYYSAPPRRSYYPAQAYRPYYAQPVYRPTYYNPGCR